MNFNEWWATLTPVEQKVIGRTTAKFVWQDACEECAKVADEWSGHYQANEIANKIRERNNP